MNILPGEDFVGRKGIYTECLLGRKLRNGSCASGVDKIDDVDMSLGDELRRISH